MNDSLNHPLQPRFALSPFDRVALTVILLLVLTVGFVIALGDQVGVQLSRVSPLGVARSTSLIRLEFSEPMDQSSLDGRVRLEPEVPGALSWVGLAAVFRPEQPLEPGQSYTVIVDPGATSDQGRAVLSEYRFEFRVAPPRVAYLYPADGVPQNIWIAEANAPETAVQITNSPTSIYDFGVSPDGSQIAFAERTTNGTSDIKLLDLTTGALQQLTNCADADCTTPVFSPDGRTIAYNRVDQNTELGLGNSPTRVWLIDLSTTPATTRPLLADLQVLGYNPQWSANGQRLAFFNRDEGVLVFDFTDNSLTVVPTRTGGTAALSPDGFRVAFPELILADGQAMSTYLRMADIETAEMTRLTPEGEPVQDERVAWRPDGGMLAVARRYQDNRFTRGYQVYLVDPEDGSEQALTSETRYSNAFFSWDPTGRQLVVQRFPELTETGQPNPDGRPEVWVLTVDGLTLTKVVENAFFPRWVP